MPQTRKVKRVKPVLNNGLPDSPLQFNVVKDNEEDKKVKEKDVFDYSKTNDVKKEKKKKIKKK